MEIMAGIIKQLFEPRRPKKKRKFLRKKLSQKEVKLAKRRDKETVFVPIPKKISRRMGK